MTRGRGDGRQEEARRMLRRLLEARFGPLPAAVVARINAESADWCAEQIVRAVRAQSLQGLGF